MRERIIEKLAEQNERLGDRIEKEKDFDEELRAMPLRQKANPFYWLGRRFSKERLEQARGNYDALLAKVGEHAAEIEGEARDFVTARKSYEEMMERLRGSFKVDSIDSRDMNDFISEIEHNFYYRDYPDDPEARTESFERNGENLAVIDFFTPQLPIQRDPGRYGFSEIELNLQPKNIFDILLEYSGKQKYRVVGYRARLPRTDLGQEPQLALTEAESRGSNNILRIVTILERGHIEASRTETYVVLDDLTREMLRGGLDLTRGRIYLMHEEPDRNYQSGSYQRGDISLSYEMDILTADQLGELEKPTEINLLIERSSADGTIDERRIKIQGTLAEVQRRVLKMVADEHLYDAVVVTEEGIEISLEEFLKHQ